MPVEARFDEALELLTRHGVEFIVVGGIAAILQGSPLTTEDVDVLYRTGQANLRRLAGALSEMDSAYADPAGRTIHPDVDRLTSTRVHLLNTRYGRVDLIRTVIAAAWNLELRPAVTPSTGKRPWPAPAGRG